MPGQAFSVRRDAVRGRRLKVTSMKNVFDAHDPANIAKAAELIKKGGVVAFPTETVYGLGADVFNEKAVCRVFEIKKRPDFDPLIVHVSNAAEAAQIFKEVPAEAVRLMKLFWPGPLTLVLPKKNTVPDLVTAGLDTVAVRVPQHAVALDFLRACGCPVAAPSANLFGHTSPTTAMAVFEDLGDAPDMVLDGGQTSVGIESTVVKIENGCAVILRPGAVTAEDIKRIMPVSPAAGPSPAKGLESPGLLASHYAPWTPLALMDKPFEAFCTQLQATHAGGEAGEKPWPRMGLLLFGEPPKASMQNFSGLFEAIEILSAKKDLSEAASNLFKAMRKLDKMSLDFIIAEPVTDGGLGVAIMDRLFKAAAGHVGTAHFFDQWAGSGQT